MKRISAWVSTHLFVLAFIVCALGGITVAATGDKHLASGLLVDSNAQLVSSPRVSTVSFLSGDKFLPNGMLIDSNSQLVSTLRDSSGNALPPEGGACGVGAIAMGTLCTITGAPSNTCTPGAIALRSDGAANTTLYVCTATNTWTAAAINGTVTTATNATNLTTTDDATTNATYCPTFQTASGGTNPLKTDCTNLTYNPSTSYFTTKNLAVTGPNSSRATCINASHQFTDCINGAIAPGFGAIAATCSSTLIVPCVATGNCATSSTASCTFTATVPTGATCVSTLKDAPAATGPWLSVSLSTNTLTVTETYTTTTTLTKNANIVCT